MEKMFTSYFRKLDEYGIIPVVKLDSADSAVPLARALIDGMLPIAEVTFRTDAAEESIKRMKEAFPEMLLGAGTVSSPDQVKRAVAAGAEFIVSPGFNETVVKYCVENGIPVLPGCSNPSDIERALSFGLTTVKFFPAEVMGGLKAIKAMAAPYVNVYFIPTGGINEANLMDYLSFQKVIACGGSWMVPDNLVRSGKFEEIKGLAEAAVKKSLGLKLGNIEINGEGERCIALMTRSVESARRYFEQLGLRFNGSTEIKDENGKTKEIYFADKFGGIAIYLMKN